MALIVVEEEIAFVRWFEISKAPGDAAGPFRVLVRIDRVELSSSRNAWRGRSTLPTADARPIDGEGKENVGIAQDVVIEKVLRAGAEVGDVEDPARQRNGKPEFVLLITFTPQRQKTKSLLRRLAPAADRSPSAGAGPDSSARRTRAAPS